MSAPDTILYQLLCGQTVGTSPMEQHVYATNSVPDAIRKLRRKYGQDAIVTTMVSVPFEGGSTRVARYHIPTKKRMKIMREMK